MGKFDINWDYLKTICNAKGISFNKLSQKVGYSRSWLNRIAHHNCKVSEDSIVKIAHILNCDPNSICVKKLDCVENYKYYNILVNNLNVIDDDKLLELANICVDELKRRKSVL